MLTINFWKGNNMTYHYYKDTKNQWRWRLKASNGRIIADSGEGYIVSHLALSLPGGVE